MKKAAQDKSEQIKEIERKFIETKKEERMKIKRKNEELYMFFLKKLLSFLKNIKNKQQTPF